MTPDGASPQRGRSVGAVVAGFLLTALLSVGTDAVMDRILTWPDHRRRGLARAVMGALASAALERGAHRGILVASEEGTSNAYGYLNALASRS